MISDFNSNPSAVDFQKLTSIAATAITSGRLWMELVAVALFFPLACAGSVSVGLGDTDTALLLPPACAGSAAAELGDAGEFAAVDVPGEELSPVTDVDMLFPNTTPVTEAVETTFAEPVGAADVPPRDSTGIPLA